MRARQDQLPAIHAAGAEAAGPPLVVMLHGCSQTASDFATGTDMNALADELGCVVLYPQQSQRANLARCWNWHRPRNQARGEENRR
ncbi:PHB depolymerase family esterase [Novosphingobium resinovorum]